MEYQPARKLGDILDDKNIVLKGADAASRGGFTQVPNFLLLSNKLSAGDKMVYAMLLSYAWHNDFCFPGQETLAKDLGVSGRTLRYNLTALQANGLLKIHRRGQGRTNIYELHLKPPAFLANLDRKKIAGLDRQKSSALDRQKLSDLL